MSVIRVCVLSLAAVSTGDPHPQAQYYKLHFMRDKLYTNNDLYNEDL